MDPSKGLEIQATVGDVLNRLGIEWESAGSGIVPLGGTPAHRWLEAIDTVTGMPAGFKVIAANEAEVDTQLTAVAEMLGIPRERLTVLPQEGWNGY